MNTYRVRITEAQWGNFQSEMVVYVRATSADAVPAAVAAANRAWTFVEFA